MVTISHNSSNLLCKRRQKQCSHQCYCVIVTVLCKYHSTPATATVHVIHALSSNKIRSQKKSFGSICYYYIAAAKKKGQLNGLLQKYFLSHHLK